MTPTQQKKNCLISILLPWSNVAESIVQVGAVVWHLALETSSKGSRYSRIIFTVPDMCKPSTPLLWIL